MSCMLLTLHQLFRLRDRKEVPIMLSPTHEEEITSLVASTLKSYKDLPIKLYQISTSPWLIPFTPHALLLADLYSTEISR